VAQGDVAAQVNLGVMHETGLGVAEDAAVAMAWYFAGRWRTALLRRPGGST
tara:strand:+ start:484 stop:636 length:153 start_codon:yes stop_codon:yes gene_type:complete